MRPLPKPAYREEFKGDTEHSTTAYIEIRERVPDQRINYL
nr:palindromic element RPE1 domain-containing protein [Rickettsia conorii]